MNRLLTAGVLFCACCVRAELDPQTATHESPVAVSTNKVAAVSTSETPETVSTNNVPEPLPVIFPVEADSYETEPISGELTALFNRLCATESGASGLAREVLIRSLDEGQGRAGTAALRSDLVKRAKQLNWDDPDMVEELISITGCEGSLEAFQDCDVQPEVWSWLFNSIERVRLVAETVTADDKPCEVASIIQQLYEYDPQERDRFLNLVLALAVVWDTPRKAMDDQVENGWLPPDDDISVYYDYFKRLYSSEQSKVPYDELSVDSLVFVVDVPTPLSELEWALENVDGSRTMWGRHYKEINYDLTRLIRGQYDWPHREYTLQEIEECFGICVDQAYYCVMTARAHGIPSLFFHGIGKYAGHAWFGFLKKPTEWDMNVGRYSDQGYAIGFATHPQTDHEMTDHELEYFAERSLQPVKARKASALKYLATLLYEEDFAEGALNAARQARQTDSLCEAAWETECDILADAERFDEAIELMDEKADQFKFFPDVVAGSRLRQAALLTCSGDAEKAEQLLRREVARVASKRDDLQQELVVAQADQLLGQGKGMEGLAVIEQILDEQRDKGLKVVALVVEYRRFAKRADLEKNADRFLATYFR